MDTGKPKTHILYYVEENCEMPIGWMPIRDVFDLESAKDIVNKRKQSHPNKHCRIVKITNTKEYIED
jgi:hypothetical protein